MRSWLPTEQRFLRAYREFPKTPIWIPWEMVGDASAAVEDSTCPAFLSMSVPVNAHIARSGDRWECNQPYRLQGDACVLP
jgi:hypothetical protein